jgi:thymidine phosphorylase
MLLQAGVVSSADEGLLAAREALSSGRALDVFGRMVHGLGGPADFAERSENYLVKAPVIVPVPAGRSGSLDTCDTRGLGLAVVELGGGRKTPSDVLDHRVGFSGLLPLGTAVKEGDPIALVHAADEASAARAVAAVMSLYTIGDERPAERPVVLKKIG